jgi:putative two-component system response regulator
MLEMDGYEAMKKLKSNTQYNEIPVIFLTHISDSQSEIKGLELGAVDYIRKPLVTPLLLQQIKIHLSMSEQQKIILERNIEIEAFLNKISSSSG